MEDALLLNATFEPISVIDWQKAVTLLTLGKVEVLESHDTEVRSVSFAIRLPAVVRLLRYVRVRRTEVVAFTRANIYARDEYHCQYCGVQFASEDLTYDHVVPATQGGSRTWDNIVAACVECNRRKGGRTPSQAGMALRRKPVRPTTSLTLRLSVGLRKSPACWRDWLYWNSELEG